MRLCAVIAVDHYGVHHKKCTRFALNYRAAFSFFYYFLFCSGRTSLVNDCASTASLQTTKSHLCNVRFGHVIVYSIEHIYHNIRKVDNFMPSYLLLLYRYTCNVETYKMVDSRYIFISRFLCDVYICAHSTSDKIMMPGPAEGKKRCRKKETMNATRKTGTKQILFLFFFLWHIGPPGTVTTRRSRSPCIRRTHLDQISYVVRENVGNLLHCLRIFYVPRVDDEWSKESGRLGQYLVKCKEPGHTHK